MEALVFSVSVTTPCVLMLVLGQILYRCKILNETFIKQGNVFLFKICLPFFIFSKMSNADFSQLQSILDITLAAQAILIGFCLLSWLLSAKIKPRQRGVFVQGSFRSNITVIGLVLVQNSYGERANALALIYVALNVIVFNVQSIVVLNAAHALQLRHTLRAEQHSKDSLQRFYTFCKKFWQNIFNIFRNPLILATCLGLLYNFFDLPRISGEQDNIASYLQWLAASGQYLVKMALPLALLCIGAKLRLQGLHSQRVLLLLVNVLKLIVLPAFGLSILLLFKVTGSENPLSLGVVFLMLSGPTATTSFIMAEQMHGDGELAANIVASTTIVSIFTMTAGLLLLRLWQLI